MHFRRSNPFKLSVFADDIFNKSISDFLGSDHTLNQPASNIVELNDRFTIDLAAPGLTKEDFNIKLDKNYLIVSSEKKSEAESGEGKFTRKEFNYSSFKRSFLLPKEANQQEISASYNNGVLSITLLKKEEEQEKGAVEIEIK